MRVPNKGISGRNLSAIVVLIFCFLVSRSFAAPDATTVGGLTCFTITPPPLDSKNPATCTELCAAKDASCTGVTSALNPPQSCEAVTQFETCRCCEVAR